MSQPIEVRTVLLTVKRKTNTIPTEVLSYEVAIIQALHGKDVVKIEDVDYGSLDVPNDAESEFQRIQGKYGEKAFGVIRSIYPSASAFADATGLQLLERAVDYTDEGAAQSMASDPLQEARKQAKAAKAKKPA